MDAPDAGKAYDVSFYAEGGKTWVVDDLSGYGKADFARELTGTLQLKATDFIVSQPQPSSSATSSGHASSYAMYGDILV
ncbi:MAG TPA: hypothetical protein VF628_09865 [Allosphingosinicella sp.]